MLFKERFRFVRLDPLNTTLNLVVRRLLELLHDVEESILGKYDRP